MARVFIGVGSNLDDPISQVTSAMDELGEIRETRLLSTSSLYQSTPLGEANQPDYINAVALVETLLLPHEFLNQLQGIEQQHHRRRDGKRWGPRTLDLDILLYDELIMNDEQLVIPHYHMLQRNFVMVPLYEIAPELRLPDGTPVSNMPVVTDMSGLTMIKSNRGRP